MDPATLIPEVLQHLHGAVPSVGSCIPTEGADTLELIDAGFRISFSDSRYVELTSPAKYGGTLIFFTGRIISDVGCPQTYTVQLHGEGSVALYRRVVDALLA